MLRKDLANFNHYRATQCINELKHNAEIKEVRIEEIPNPDESKEFYPVLADNKAVTSLDVNLRFDEPMAQNAFLATLPPELINRLKKFHYLSRVRDEKLFETLSKCISQSPTIEEVELYCPIYTETLANAVSLSKSIKKLKLASCGIGDKGAKELAKGLLQNTSLTELDLTNSGIKADGSVEIVRAVAAQGKINS